MISIITTSYNYSEYISETIKSVLAQTYSDWELIIVDDASSDNSVEIIKSFCNDKRIKLICHNKNKGLKESIKTGLKYACGDWIAFLESDDTFNPETLQKRYEKIDENTKIIFNDVHLIGDEEWVNETKKQVSQTKKKLAGINFPTNIFKLFETQNPVLTFSCVMIKKELITDEILNSPSDSLLDWWVYINLSFKNEFDYLPEKLTNWRIHPNSYIKSPRKSLFCMVNALAYINVFKKNPSLNLLIFIVKCIFKMSFIRLKVYLIKFIRKLKSMLGLKVKKSPLFD